MLTDYKIRSLKAPVKTQKVFDGDGLYLELAPSGGRWWRLKYRYAGKEKRLSLGTYPAVPLSQARRARDEAKALLALGTDPSASRKAKKIAVAAASEHAFERVARMWHASWAQARSGKHAAQVLHRLELDVFPAIGCLPIGDVHASHVVALAKAVEARGAMDLARRAIQICGQIYRYAIAHGLATANPARGFNPGDVLQPVVEQNRARVDMCEMPKLLRAIDAYHGHVRTKMALQMAALTFVRPSELVAARWEEIDFDAAQWRIPPRRMKMKTPHIVPLSRQALALLRDLRCLSPGDLLFPGAHDHETPMSTNAPLYALYKMGYRHKMTTHGFRGVASTALHEQGFEHVHIELQLAHIERDRVSAAYNHALYINQRAAMMQAWADYLDMLRAAR